MRMHTKRKDRPKRLFALDQNFPVPIVRALAESIPEAEMVPIRAIDERLPKFKDDWRVLLALYNHERPWDGLITTDSGMLRLSKELRVLEQTKLTLVVPLFTGHDPILATGLVLTHLPTICRTTDREIAQIWRLSAQSKAYEAPGVFLESIATKSGHDVEALRLRNELTPPELAVNPLAPENVAAALPPENSKE